MRSHLRSNLVAYLALFVALGGTSYAAIKLPKNSVGAKQIKKNAVKSKKVKNRSLKAVDFKVGELPAGAKGDPGATGATGPIGPIGPSFALAVTTTADDPRPNPTGSTADEISFSLPTAGRTVFHYFTPGLEQACSSGNGFAGLYVDGEPVPATSISVPSSNGFPQMIGGMVHLAAGQHTAAIRMDCPLGNGTSAGYYGQEVWSVQLSG